MNFFDEEVFDNIPLKEYTVEVCSRKYIEPFIEKYHYSGSINGCMSTYHFALHRGSELVGAMFYGRLGMPNQYKRFTDNQSEIIELRRLCCIDDTPKNTESYFIARTLKWLKLCTDIKLVVSYADAEYGHDGTIYKASNFEYVGFTEGAKVVVDADGNKFHYRSAQTKRKGKGKAKLKPFAQELSQSLEDGTAVLKQTKGKHCYLYRLRK